MRHLSCKKKPPTKKNAQEKEPNTPFMNKYTKKKCTKQYRMFQKPNFHLYVKKQNIDYTSRAD